MLKLVNIIKDYRVADSVVHAVKGVNLNFRKSEFVSILGPSGCGKTTLLNIIGGLDQYTDGDLIINDKSTKEFRSRDWDAYRNRSIGFIFQSYNLIPHLNVLQNVELALTISGVSRKKKRKLAVDALERVGLGSQLKKKPNQMSGGQMQRVAIARAIVNNPEIILADEPTGALDTKTSEQVMDLLQEIADDRLVIMVTHNPELAQRYSTRIIELMDGEVVADSNPYDGMPAILSPVSAMSDEGSTPIEEYIAHSADAEAEVHDTIPAEEPAPEKEEKKPAKGKKSKSSKKKKAENVLDDATATTEDAESSALRAGGTAAVSAPVAPEEQPAESAGDAPADAHASDADEKFVALVSPEKPVQVRKHSGKPKREKKERTSMSFITALGISARNLVAKRTRTFLTAFAGSIGIIGIALVLSLSNGFDLYMGSLEESILSSMPLTINSMALDIDVESLMNMEFDQGDGEQYPDTDYVTPYNPTGVMGLQGLQFGINVLTDEYMEYVQGISEVYPESLNAVRYSYGVNMPILVKTGPGDTNADYTLIESTSNMISDAMSSMGMSSNPIGWQQLLWDDFMLAQFDVLAGGYPGTEEGNAALGASYEDGEDYNGNKAHSAVLVINSYNMIDDSILEALGMELETDENGDYLPIDFDEIIGKEISVVSNNNYYNIPDSVYNASGTGFDDSKVLNGTSFRPEARASVNTDITSYDPDDNITVTIVGVMRVKSNILTPLLQSGVAYTEDLVQLVLDKAADSEIVKYQEAYSSYDVLEGTKFSFDFSQIVSLIESVGISEAEAVSGIIEMLLEGDFGSMEGGDIIAGIIDGLSDEQKEELRACKTISSVLTTVQGWFPILSDEMIRAMLPNFDIEIMEGLTLSGESILALIDSAYDNQMKLLGGSDTPTGAYIYPTTFEEKDKICAYLDAWNDTNPGMSVTYMDNAGTISSLLTQVVDIVSYILIAFSAISLVVSSVMIAIITYVSVLERTTEIGVLRSIGARKLDISNLFNAETAIIGAAAGILGVFLAWIIDFPINAWIASLATQAPANFAVLNPLHALLLVVLSIGLTVISGLVPAIAAARKDPVKALRSTG